MYDTFIKAHLANHVKSIIYANGRYFCTDIHWHLRPCLTVMWLATRPYKHEQICSMTARLCFNIYYETGSYCMAQKKLIVSRQPILVNLKSNTMKNTMQNYSVLK